MMKPFFLLLIFAFGSAAFAEQPMEPTQEAKPFVHPGLLHSRAELEYIKEKIKSGEEPWKSAWDKLLTSRSSNRRSRRRRPRQADRERLPASSLEYEPSPSANVVRGPYNDPNIGSSDFSHDSMSVSYTHLTLPTTPYV